MNRETMALVAIGSNLGNPVVNVLRAFERLAEISAAPVRRASLWKSTPVDCPPGSPPFVNSAAVLVPLPGETPESLLANLQQIELDSGRRRTDVINAPRTLDLDLIAFGTQTRQTRRLVLPHPRAHLRRFVLQPLAEIVPDFVLPGQNRSIAVLLASLNKSEKLVLLPATAQ